MSEITLNFKNKNKIYLGSSFRIENHNRDSLFISKTKAKNYLKPKVLTNYKRYSTENPEGTTPPPSADLSSFQFFSRDSEVNKKRGLPEDTITDNLIIKGNNLLALSSLLEEFRGKVKLIYIDPPYNTGNDGFNYNDKFNHSTWLTFMKNRLELAKELLREDGLLFVHIDYREHSRLHLLLNEVFSSGEYISTLICKVKSPSGTGSTASVFLDVIEYILVYIKHSAYKKYLPKGIKISIPIQLNDRSVEYYSYRFLKKFKHEDLEKIQLPSKLSRKFQAYQVPKEKFTIEKVKPKTIRELRKISEELFGMQSLYRGELGELRNFLHNKDSNGLFFIMYGTKTPQKRYLYKGRVLTPFSKSFKFKDKQIYRLETLTNFLPVNWHGIGAEGETSFNNGKKPESLLSLLLENFTSPSDIVLDFFLGSGTTAAVAHKLGRQYIGVEQMDYINTVAVPRLQKVITGEDKYGISKDVNWTGGGEFVYVELKPLVQEFISKLDKLYQTKSISEEILTALEGLVVSLKKTNYLKENISSSDIDEILEKVRNFDLKLGPIKKKRIFKKLCAEAFSLIDLTKTYTNLETLSKTDKDFLLNKSFYSSLN